MSSGSSVSPIAERSAAATGPQLTRLMSLDALRGFDMLCIAGADAVGGALRKFDGGSVGGLLAAQFEHVKWEGLHFYDLIFPLFIFMVGVAVTYSLGKSVAAGDTRRAAVRVLKRSAILYLVGVFYYGGLAHGFAGVRWLGVLQRIALCYLATSLLFLYVRRRWQVAACLALLVGYWALMTFVPVPGFGAGDFTVGHNLCNWIDQHYLPGRLWYGTYDPEGLLSTLPAIATCLLGVFAGELLRDEWTSERQKVAWLVGAGVVLLVLGNLWGLQFPVVKRIWTSSYVLVAGGWSALLLAGFYLVIDVWKLRAWATPFVWVGTNALTIYLLGNVVDLGRLAERFVGGGISGWLDARWTGLGAMVLMLTNLGLCLAVARFLYHRKLFLRL